MGDQSIRLGTDGYFVRGGERFVPIGANYWAGSCGGRMWGEWPAEEIQRDLDWLVHHGFNSIRFFLRLCAAGLHANDHDGANCCYN